MGISTYAWATSVAFLLPATKPTTASSTPATETHSTTSANSPTNADVKKKQKKKEPQPSSGGCAVPTPAAPSCATEARTEMYLLVPQRGGASQLDPRLRRGVRDWERRRRWRRSDSGGCSSGGSGIAAGSCESATATDWQRPLRLEIGNARWIRNQRTSLSTSCEAGGGEKEKKKIGRNSEVLVFICEDDKSWRPMCHWAFHHRFGQIDLGWERLELSTSGSLK